MSKFSDIRIEKPKTPARATDTAKGATRGRGGRGGRSGDPENYTPLTVYIDAPVYRAFKARLALEDRNFSGVITDLMREWLERPSESPQKSKRL